MKKLLIYSYCLYGLGFFVKFFHIHFNAVLMLVGLVGILIGSLVLLFQKDERYRAALNFGAFGWLVALLITIKFFPFGLAAFILAIVLSILALVVFIRKQKPKAVWPLSLLAVITILFFNLPTDTRFYWLNVKWNYEIARDYGTLDKYSWFLYRNGKEEEAVRVSAQALEMAKANDEQEWVEFIEEHARRIQENDWNTYR